MKGKMYISPFRSCVAKSILYVCVIDSKGLLIFKRK